MAKTRQELLKEYTDSVKYDPRTFGEDVMSYEQFSDPFRLQQQQIVEDLYRPEFLRYEYNPAVRAAAQELGQANQNIGVSGAWRNADSAQQLSNLAEDRLIQQEQLTRRFNDRVLDMQDRFRQQLVDPLYQQRMVRFYDSPTRNVDTGDIVAQYGPNETPMANIETGGTNATPGGIASGFTGGPESVQQMSNDLITQYLGNNTVNDRSTYGGMAI